MHKNKTKTTGLILFCLVLTLILPILSNTPIIFSEQNENDEKLTPITAAPDVTYNNIFTIEQSVDDAWTRTAGTNYTSDGLELGGNNGLTNAAQRRICLRWNLSIPQNARIIDAYITLTVKDTSISPLYGGITANIQAFQSSATPPFNDTNENIQASRSARTAAVVSPLGSPLAQNDTVQTSDISSIVQTIVNRGDWVNNSIFGVYIYPTAVTGVPAPGELIEFWSYDAGNSTFYPKLYVEWEESPYFLATPTDFSIQNGTLGYFFEWSAGDDNPDKYILSNNVSGTVQEGDWQSGETFRYDIPALSEGIYNYTMYHNDTDGNYDEANLILTVTNLNLPNIDIKNVQNGVETDYLNSGDGPFTMQITNNSAVNTIDYDIQGYFPNFEVSMMVEVLVWWILVPMSPYSDVISHGVAYNDSLGYYPIAPGVDEYYTWTLEMIVPTMYQFFYKYIQDIEYDVTNIITIDVNSGADFIYNNTVYSYGGTWDELEIQILNKDIMPPVYDLPEILIPVDSSKNFGVQINITDYEFGSQLKNVTLFYSTDGGITWGSMKMLFFEGLWIASIPPQDPGTRILYKVEYIDWAGNEVTTAIYEVIALDYGGPTILIPGIIVIIALVGALAAVVIYRRTHRITPKSSKKDLILEKKLKHLEQRTEEVGEKLHKIKNQREEI